MASGQLVETVTSTKPLTRMVRQHRYEPVGQCIYCGAPASSDEHIIARSLGGTLVLPDASCGTCRDVTSSFERHCANGTYASVRRQFGFPTYHKKRVRPQRTVEVDGEPLEIPDHDYPGLLVGFNFPLPSILGLSPPAPAALGGGIAIQNLPDFGERLNRVDRRKRGVTLKTDLEARQFGRMLAKIAHGFAVGELGFGGFRPLLQDVVRNDDPQFMGRLIGGAFLDPGPGTDLHEIALDRKTSPRHVLIHLRLFADRGMPSYWVVTGEL